MTQRRNGWWWVMRQGHWEIVYLAGRHIEVTHGGNEMPGTVDEWGPYLGTEPPKVPKPVELIPNGPGSTCGACGVEPGDTHTDDCENYRRIREGGTA